MRLFLFFRVVFARPVFLDFFRTNPIYLKHRAGEADVKD